MDNIENKDLKKKGPFKFALPLILLLVVGIIGFGVYEYFRIAPRDVRFTNVTSSSVTVSWDTKKPMSSSVIVFEGDTPLPVRVLCPTKRKFYDTRDVKLAELNAALEAGAERDDLSLAMDDFKTEVVVEERGDYYTHHVSVEGLDPESEYSFMVGDTYLFRKVKDIDNNFVVKSTAIPETIRAPRPAYGFVKDALNQSELPIDELPAITDGVLYFNYYENNTGARSNVFSSSLNELGAWYVDIGGAVDSNGEPFFEVYDGLDYSFMVELTLDAGQLGVWKVTRPDGGNSPMEPMIINFPAESEDEDSVVRVRSFSNPFVQQVFAIPLADIGPLDCLSAQCQFPNYCGPCRKQCSDGKWYQCDCSVTTLEARNCPGYNNPEVPPSCGSSPIGAVKLSGVSCYVCTLKDNAGVKTAEWVFDNNKYDPTKYCATRTTCTPKSCAQYGAAEDFTLSSCPTGEVCQTKAYIDSCSGKTVTCYRVPHKDLTAQPAACVPRSCKDINTLHVKYLESCPSGEQCNLMNLADKCGGTVQCYQCKTSPAVNQRVCGAYQGDDWYGSRICPGGARCESFKGDWGQCGTLPCYRVYTEEEESLHACVIQTCAELSPNEFKLPSCPPTRNCIRKEFETCGKARICYKDIGSAVGEGLQGAMEAQSERIGLSAYLQIKAGAQCPEFDNTGLEVGACDCKGGIDDFVMPGQYCRETSPYRFLGIEAAYCKKGAWVGAVCSKAGETCITPEDPTLFQSIIENIATVGILNLINRDLGCWGPPPGSNSFMYEDDSLGLNALDIRSVLGRKTYAQTENESPEYIVDFEKGAFVGLPIGKYVVEYGEETYVADISTDGEGASTILYVDVNKNGSFEENLDVNISETSEVIKFSPLKIPYDYQLEEGFNLVTFPFLLELEGEGITAAGLLKYLNETYENSIYSISKFEGGRWKIVGQNVEVFDTNDFQLLPGEGYAIKSMEDFSFTLEGQPVKFEEEGDDAPILLSTGWNLIGLYGTKVKTYTARTLIEDINKETFLADNVTEWDKSKQMYEGLQISEGEEYGFDFPINTLESYFVRILQGSGKWQPDLEKN